MERSVALPTQTVTTVNPATEREIATYDLFSNAEVERRLARAEVAFERHRQTDVQARSEKMLRAADLLEQRARNLGETMTREMGKPIGQAEAEAEKCAWVCRYYAEHAARFLEPEVVETDARKSYVAFQPLGPVLAVMPWNFPLWQVFRFAAPALMAGNVGLLKHASNVFGCALAIEDVLREAGFDDDEFQTLLVSSDQVEGIISDVRVKAATLTGSEGAGRAVGGAAGKAIKPSVLELGGSDPFIVLADADLDQAVQTGVQARMQNNAQSCIAAKRFIVEESVLEAFTERFVEEMEKLTTGDPMDEATDVGPMARGDLRDEVHEQVQRSLEDGARLLTGGEKLDRTGYYYRPTVLADVRPGMVAFEEEIFGPVASIIAAPRCRPRRRARQPVAVRPWGCRLHRRSGERRKRRAKAGCRVRICEWDGQKRPAPAIWRR